jgi:hypothetical protein
MLDLAIAEFLWLRPRERPDRPAVRSIDTTPDIAIVGIQVREGRELARAAQAAGLAVRPLAFGSPLVDAALAAHGPGSVRLPLAIVAGRYTLQRPPLGAVLECIEVLRGTRQTLPKACVALAATPDVDRDERPAIEAACCGP